MGHHRTLDRDPLISHNPDVYCNKAVGNNCALSYRCDGTSGHKEKKSGAILVFMGFPGALDELMVFTR